MRRKLVCILAAFGLVMGLVLRCAAAEEYGSIRITLEKEADRSFYGTVSLYRVGVPVKGGFRLGSGYGGGFVEEADAQSPVLAQWLAERAGIADGMRVLDSDGSGEFMPLEEGLYLLVQTDPMDGFYPFVPFLVQLPYQGQWDILAFPKLERIPVGTPQTGEDPMLKWYMIGMAGSGMGLLLCLGRRKRYQ